ncbi:hypothetical protein [Actinokineospora bangkokensis]|uniref:Uncharacterized protein n=1 Tax=Actinokineospora bangkokensis TaxID=1193682 RepID=A0A1Q9LGW1_9PSEU|nr:hypothetical protein [Actinokineospora bangkokensis]OLR91282.1 hypothetical protein BJP25_26820 [Actinokineospora bangkokensis]
MELRVDELVGRTIRRVRRVHYVDPGGEADTASGFLELRADDGFVALFDSGADGRSIRVEAREWVDPFTEPLTSANREFVRKHGRWAVFDRSAADGYAQVVGNTVVAVHMARAGGKVVGVDIVLDRCFVSMRVSLDELRVCVCAV